MRTSVIAIIFVLLIALGFFLFSGGKSGTEEDQGTTPTVHEMPDGTVMDNNNSMEGMHMMPDGTPMVN